MIKTTLLLLVSLLLTSCLTFYREDENGRPTYATSADGSGFRQTRPDGTVTEVWGGVNSTGQEKLKDFGLGAITRVELGKTIRAASANDLKKAEAGFDTKRVTDLRKLSNEVETTRIKEAADVSKAAIAE